MNYTKGAKDIQFAWKIVCQNACGCHANQILRGKFKGSYTIEYCPRHKAAPKMYEALKTIYSYDLEFPPEVINQGWEALAEAEGRAE